MMARTYNELATDADVDRWLEADAREYARANGKPYPYPSERYSKGCPESSKPGNWIRIRTHVIRHNREDAPRLPGGVVVVTAETRSGAGKTVRLQDGSRYKLPGAEKTRAELSAKARRTLEE